MKRWFSTVAAVLFFSAALRADVTFVQTTTIEGGMAQMAAQAGQNVAPTITTKIKGSKSRTDIVSGPISMSTIVDVEAKQLIILRADQKTATIVAAAAAPSVTPTAQGPTMGATIKPTGKSQTIDGVQCDEYTFTTSVDMSSMTANTQMPPEAAAMMKGVKILVAGSAWMAKDAPGAAEYVAFQKTLAASDLASAASGMSGMSIPGLREAMKAMSGANGMTYLNEATVSFEGEGQMVEMMKQMGPMKVTSKVSSISTEALSDDLFKVPEGYTIVKQ
jgi:hypothetical protein